MGRRKPSHIQDDFSSDSDVSIEDELDAGSKRKLRGNRDDFDMDEVDMAEAEARGRRQDKLSAASYLKGQAFVKASVTDAADRQDQVASSSSSSSGDEDGNDDDLEDEDGIGGRPSFAGIGASRAQANRAATTFTPASFVSSRGGIGSSKLSTDVSPARAGIGARRTADNDSAEAGPSKPPTFARATMQGSGMPTSFGPSVTPSDAFTKKPEQAKPKRSFLSGPPMTDIKFGGGLGGGFNPAAYLASMGWEGGGLGEKGQGIDKPIEVQLRPERAGIAFGGRRERTKQEREAARKRGEEGSDYEEDLGKRRGLAKKGSGTATPESTSTARPWTKRSGPKKPAVQYQTYDEIVEAAGSLPSGPSDGPIIDARGREQREIASLASALSAHPVPTSDSTRLPELRHNLRLIADNSKQTLDAFAKDGANILQRRAWLKREKEESARRSAKEDTEIEALKVTLSLVQELEALGKRSLVDTSIDLQNFTELASRIASKSEREIETSRLDEALAGAIVPVFKRAMMAWAPLEDAEAKRYSTLLQAWSKPLKLPKANSKETREVMDRFAPQSHSRQRSRVSEMTPFEAVLWHLWMPKVRSALNNDWKPHHPRAAIALLTAWRPLLPQYLWDNLIDQVLVAKLHRVIHDWESRTARASLHHILFPWLPLLGDRLDDCMTEARRRLRSTLKGWKMRDADSSSTPSHVTAVREEEHNLRRDIEHWREMFPSRHEFDSMMLVCVVPKLASHLQKRFKVDPSKQDILPLDRVLAWRKLLRSSVLVRLLEAEFLPKWLVTLHGWLIQPGVDLGQVAEWYSFWKSWFKDQGGIDVDGPDAAPGKKMHGLKRGFDKGIELISQAVELGDDDEGRKMELPRPDTTPLSRSAAKLAEATAAPQRGASVRGSRKQPGANVDEDDEEVSFRAVVEEQLLNADVLLLPLNRAHERTGKRLLRATSASAMTAGTGGSSQGVVFYLDGDVIWAQEKQSNAKRPQQAPGGSGGDVDFAPISLDELIKRAGGGTA